jgi:FkbM family methyltransferase
MPSLERVALPGQLDVWAPNAFEASLLYQQVVVEQVYQRHGIELPDHATVFDVGANFGLFTVHLARTIPGVSVHAFEPIPAVFDALQRNIAEHAPGSQAHNMGLAARSGEAVFEVDRFATMASTMHPEMHKEIARRQVRMASWIAASLADLEKVAPDASWLRPARRALERPLARLAVLAVLAPIFLLLQLRRWLFLQRPICRLHTLSAMLKETGVASVDLVKIDVEGAEEEVLDGIDDADWPRLRQMVIEVHDVDGRVDRMADLLERRGYRTVRARDEWATVEVLGIYTLYAVRS